MDRARSAASQPPSPRRESNFRRAAAADGADAPAGENQRTSAAKDCRWPVADENGRGSRLLPFVRERSANRQRFSASVNSEKLSADQENYRGEATPLEQSSSGRRGPSANCTCASKSAPPHKHPLPRSA